MKTYTAKQLAKILKDHALWLQDASKGTRANLSDADLYGANLYGANLYGADLRSANLYGADLRGADLSCANLSCANLSGANLYGADLDGANLSCADLYGANLYGADLRSANLYGADLRGAILPDYKILQDNVKMYGYKKSREGYIVTIEIADKTKRVCSLIGRKCRTERAKVISVEKVDGTKIDKAHSYHQKDFVYKVGTEIVPDSYNDDIRVECTNGIHFFITREEAERY